MRTITRLYGSYTTAQAVVRDLEAAGIPHNDLSIIARDTTEAPAATGYADTSVRDHLTDNASDRPSAAFASSPTGVSNLAADRGTAEISEDRVGGHETPLETTTGTGLGGGLGVDAGRPPNVTDSTLAGDQSGGGVTPSASTSPHHTAHHSGAETGAATGASAGTVIGGGLGLLAGIGALAIPGVGPVVAAGWLVATITGAGVGAGAGGLIGALTGAGVSRDESDTYAEAIRRGDTLVSARVDDARAGEVEAIMDRHNPLDWQERRRSYASGAAGDADPGLERAEERRIAEPVHTRPSSIRDYPKSENAERSEPRGGAPDGGDLTRS